MRLYPHREYAMNMLTAIHIPTLAKESYFTHYTPWFRFKNNVGWLYEEVLTSRLCLYVTYLLERYPVYPEKMLKSIKNMFKIPKKMQIENNHFVMVGALEWRLLLSSISYEDCFMKDLRVRMYRCLRRTFFSRQTIAGCDVCSANEVCTLG